MSDTPCRRLEEDLWKLPAFALVSPPIVFMLALVPWPYQDHLFEAFLLLGSSSPVLGLVTWAVLAIQYVMLAEELNAGKTTRRRVAVLAGLAIIAPAWLVVMWMIAVLSTGGR